jgi:hypothetical protein
MNPSLDNPFYYLDNFQRVLDWIAERYGDLLTEDEHAFIARFPALPRPARALFVRMVMRKGTLFRASKLNYAEIGSPLAAADALHECGWVHTDPAMTIDELFELLSKPEIGAVFGLSTVQKSARKADQLAALRGQFSDARAFSAWFQGATDKALGITIKPLCDRLRLIFFGNLRQDWSEFVLAELGLYKYEQVAISHAARGFRSRRDIDNYLALHQCKQRFHASATPADVLAALPAHALDNDWLDGRRERLLYQIGQQYEQQRDWPNAYQTYARCRFPGARARAVRVLEKDHKYGAANALLKQAQSAPESEAERQQLLRIAPRLARQLGHVPPARRRPAPVTRLKLQLPPPPTPRPVEYVVRDHLASDDAPAFYVENALINALFGLLCWSAIFQPIPGAFFHPFHRGPADLYSADFVPRRAAAFAACLAELDDERYRATIGANAAAKWGVQSPFLDWDFLTPALLALALDCIPAAHIKLWCEHILADVKANRTGFPDLIQFWPAEHRYNMVEVKGPGDRLQDNQLRWIDFCAAQHMPVSVCYLQWSEARA